MLSMSAAVLDATTFWRSLATVSRGAGRVSSGAPGTARIRVWTRCEEKIMGGDENKEGESGRGRGLEGCSLTC
eukprot:scaffold5797_cov115-Isochrysis_galbana.AAC.4